jgi:hypothetical protein
MAVMATSLGAPAHAKKFLAPKSIRFSLWAEWDRSERDSQRNWKICHGQKNEGQGPNPTGNFFSDLIVALVILPFQFPGVLAALTAADTDPQNAIAAAIAWGGGG